MTLSVASPTNTRPKETLSPAFMMRLSPFSSTSSHGPSAGAWPFLSSWLNRQARSLQKLRQAHKQKVHLQRLDSEGAPSTRRLWLYYELTFHPAVADTAAIAAVEGVSARCARHKFHDGSNSLFELEAVIVRIEDEARVAFLLRSIRAQIDLEAVGSVESRDL